MSAVGRKLFSGSKKVKKGPVYGGGAPKSDGEITPESPGSVHGGRLSAGYTVSVQHFVKWSVCFPNVNFERYWYTVNCVSKFHFTK